MTNHDNIHELSSEDLRAIDVLVDGELDNERRRQLLASLDYTADGWRRLALTFVESQTLQRDLCQLVGETRQPPPATALPRRGALAATSLSGRVFIALAMAASFLVALSLGIIWRGVTSSPAPTTESVAVQGNGTSDDKVDWLHEPSQQLAADAATSAVEPSVAAGVQPAMAVRPDIELPVMATGGEAALWTQSALPPHIAQLLQQLGHQVETQRKLVPLDLPDGRRVVVPVEQVEVEFLDNTNYQ